MPLASASPQRGFQCSPDLHLRLPNPHSGQNLLQSLLGQYRSGPDGRDFLWRLAGALPLNQLGGRNYPPSSKPAHSLGIPDGQRVRLDPHGLERAGGQQATEALPHAPLVDLYRRDRRGLLGGLSRVAEIRHQQGCVLADQKQRRRSAEAGEISDVGKMGDQ
jgi:hypothetical protein